MGYNAKQPSVCVPVRASARLERLLYVFIVIPSGLVFVLGIQFFELRRFRLQKYW
jgi:hypothetical protein